MRLARTGSTVGTRLIVRDTVAVDTLASRAISRSVSPSLIVIATVSDNLPKNSTPLPILLLGLIEAKIRAEVMRGRTLFGGRMHICPEPGPKAALGDHPPAAQTAASRHCLPKSRTERVRCQRPMRASE